LLRLIWAGSYSDNELKETVLVHRKDEREEELISDVGEGSYYEGIKNSLRTPKSLYGGLARIGVEEVSAATKRKEKKTSTRENYKVPEQDGRTSRCEALKATGGGGKGLTMPLSSHSRCQIAVGKTD